MMTTTGTAKTTRIPCTTAVTFLKSYLMMKLIEGVRLRR